MLERVSRFSFSNDGFQLKKFEKIIFYVLNSYLQTISLLHMHKFDAWKEDTNEFCAQADV
jgi:hypothetical protein